MSNDNQRIVKLEKDLEKLTTSYKYLLTLLHRQNMVVPAGVQNYERDGEWK